MPHRLLPALSVAALCSCVGVENKAPSADAVELPTVSGVELQPLMAQLARLRQGLAALGSPLPPAAEAQLDALAAAPPTADVLTEVQTVLDRSCLAMVHINPEARVSVRRGPAAAELMQEGWRSFLIKVHNEAAVTMPLRVDSPNALPRYRPATNASRPPAAPDLHDAELMQRFLALHVVRERPFARRLSGLALEYVVVQLHTRAVGPREVRLAFDVGSGTSDLAFRSSLDVLFECVPAVKTVLGVRDSDGRPTMASFLITEAGRSAARGKHIYPLPSRRLARDDEYPDFFFQPHVYRQDGEHVYLPPGSYDITVRRGPESLPRTRRAVIPEGVQTHRLDFEVERWVHMAALGWYSVDHHVHAAGCSHYDAPAQGVEPGDIWRQGVGEDLNVSSILTWGPCWYHQKEFFDGRVHRLSTADNVMRFDVEVSGFPSSHAGHVCLLRLREDDYPGAGEIEDWPSWTLPVLRWARQQGGVVGYAHSALGLVPEEKTTVLPNYEIPPFDGIGANEYIVTVAHDAVDFISAGDTPPVAELNIWYHTLNCGFRARIAGETDFPCLSDARVGQARSYVRLDGALDFDACVDAIRRGRSYVSDGAAHIIDFRADGAELGVDGSELRLDRAKTVRIEARVAAHMGAAPEQMSPPSWSAAMDPGQGKAMDRDDWFTLFEQRPFWSLEKARISETDKVPVELVVNGEAVARREVVADGAWNTLEFDIDIARSSWLALRVFPSCHTNPIFVVVGDQPIRASEASAAWCRDGVERCWAAKKDAIRAAERDDAKRAYDHARAVYERIRLEARAAANP